MGEPLPAFEPPGPQRSRNMAAITGRDTKPEMFARRALHRNGFRFRLHRSDLPGRPDMVLSRYRLVVLVHGCFWHGHICRIGHLPKSNTAYWSAKIERNIARDARNRSALEALGWHVATVRECTLEQDTEQLLMELNHIRAATRKRVDTGTPLN